MADQLTFRQQEILDFISASIVERGFPPTLREIGEHFQIRSTNGVNDHLKALEKKGHLRREDLKSRAMRPTAMINQHMSPYPNHVANPAGAGADIVPLRPRVGSGTLEMEALPGLANLAQLSDDLCAVPILGRVAAGQPILAVEQAEDTVKVDRMLIGNHRDVFGLRIVGESMIEDGILDGDYVFVKKTPSASPGEIVVAMIEGEATVKRYFPEGDHIRFQPANQNMSPIIVRRADFKSVDIIGIVVGVYRKL